MKTSVLQSHDELWSWKPEKLIERYRYDDNDNRVSTIHCDICTTRRSVVCAATGDAVDESRDEDLSGVPGGLLLPCAVLMWIQVPFPLRRRGFGKAALKEFESIAIKHCCPMAFLQLGAHDLEELERNRQFYESQGWQCCENYEPYRANMYKRLPSADSGLVLSN